MPIVFLLILLFVLRYLWVRLRVSLRVRHRLWGAAAFVFGIVLVFLYRALPPPWLGLGAVVFTWGGFNLVFLSNWLMVCALFDAWLGLRRLTRFASRRMNKASRLRWLPRLAGATLLLTVFFYLIGVPRQLDFHVNHVTVRAHTPLERPLRLVLFTDTHFDLLFPRSKLAALVDTLHALQPDAVLFGGDLADVPATTLNARGLDALMRSIRPPLGFWGVTGNHEAYMNPEGRTLEWMGEVGMRVLQDSTVCTDFFCITGRQDPQFARLNGQQRTPLYKLSPPAYARAKPWLVLDHQPKGLDENDLPVPRQPDLVLSGHTHDGQFFPWTWAIHLFWKIPAGLGIIGNTPWLVSSGFGQWGPPIRMGSQAEIVCLTIQ